MYQLKVNTEPMPATGVTAKAMVAPTADLAEALIAEALIAEAPMAEGTDMLCGLNHITLAVRDVDASLAFYSGVLGFTGHVKWDRGAYLSVGELWLCLSLDEPDARTDYSHIAFDAREEDFPRITARLQAAGITCWKTNQSEGDSLYVLDPDGHKLEIHCGNLRTRLEALQTEPYSGLTWL